MRFLWAAKEYCLFSQPTCNMHRARFCGNCNDVLYEARSIVRYCHRILVQNCTAPPSSACSSARQHLTNSRLVSSLVRLRMESPSRTPKLCAIHAVPIAGGLDFACNIRRLVCSRRFPCLDSIAALMPGSHPDRRNRRSL